MNYHFHTVMEFSSRIVTFTLLNPGVPRNTIMKTLYQGVTKPDGPRSPKMGTRRLYNYNQRLRFQIEKMAPYCKQGDCNYATVQLRATHSYRQTNPHYRQDSFIKQTPMKTQTWTKVRKVTDKVLVRGRGNKLIAGECKNRGSPRLKKRSVRKNATNGHVSGLGEATTTYKVA